MSDDVSIARRTVLLVDDEALLLQSASIALRAAGFAEVATCDDSRSVMALLAAGNVALALIDLTMPHLSGQQLLKEISSTLPEVPVIVMTATNDLETAVQCMQDGAVDYLLKPVEKDRLVAAVRRALEMRALKSELRLLRDIALSGPKATHAAFTGIATQNQQMLQILRYLELVATSAHPVLITGESGTGKELVAQAVHRISGRSGPFVTVNVAGLDDNLFSDTLFGHRKGSFSGATLDREGLVKHAAEGTLFLDEIGDLTVASQVKLLRLLQDGSYYPLGSDVPMRSRARIVVATNCDVRKNIDGGQFRKDLYFRLSTHQVRLPPLRARREDLPLLIARFFDASASALGKTAPTVPRELYQLLGTYDFPGNVRELEGMCMDAMAQHEGGILSLRSFRAAIAGYADATAPAAAPPDAGLLRSWPDKLPTLADAEEALIDEALRRAKGNQGIAAGILGISRQALNRRLVQQRQSAQSENQES